MTHPKFTYLFSSNADYIDELLEKYQKDPDSVDPSWRWFFEGLEIGATSESVANGIAKSQAPTTPSVQVMPSTGKKLSADLDLSSEAKVAELIVAYRSRGNVIANVNPLNPAPISHPLLDLTNFGLQQSDLERTFTAGNLIGMGQAPLKEILARLRKIYCSTIGFEVSHIEEAVQREWLFERMEKPELQEQMTTEDKKFVLSRLSESETFEHFLHTRYVAQKRFSVEGGESLIPALDRIIEVAGSSGVNNIVMGMAHRGRLNVLTNTFGKKPELIFTEFEQSYEADRIQGEGDVKYHMGFSSDVVTRKGHSLHLSLAHNPSHLEFVNPVVEGIARAKQRDQGDFERVKVIPILIHGDAAFAGQGIVFETLNLANLTGYTTGGTIHIIIDNQIGFTTEPRDSRSTRNTTDVAKMLQAPIFHVNGDDPEAVWKVAKLVTDYRQRFKRDAFINLICYRKYGHNEGDEPGFTQPLMYEKIKNHPTTRQIYAGKMVEEGVMTTEAAQAVVDTIIQKLTEAQQRTRSEKPSPFYSAYSSKWQGLRAASEADMFTVSKTAVAESTLKNLSEKLTSMPGGFNLHKKLARFFEARKAAIDQGINIDWGNAETLAYASLLIEGHTIRISGQDVLRGTFSHRHATVFDTTTGQPHTPLSNLDPKQAELIIFNSALSEAAVLGFEYGWSLTDPNALVIWEAQFGDFANGAQVIIDQFIASSESKWQRASGIVLLLPHGYEGQGPEHSSARLERFLQLCGKNNLAVCNFSTPAQLFHALRRQLKREFRKPMVVMTPKSLLRHPLCVSTLKDLSEGQFHEVLDDPFFSGKDATRNSGSARRVLLCSGKIYYELLAEREDRKIHDVAIVRIEQLYPFAAHSLAEIVNRYAKAEIVWVQEEPRNMGAWNSIVNYWYGGYNICFREMALNREIRYVGRERGAAPAVGSAKVHAKTQKEIIEKALSS